MTPAVESTPGILDRFAPAAEPLDDDLCLALQPARFFVEEWREYVLPAEKGEELTLAGVRQVKLGDRLWRLKFENQLGLAELRLASPSRPDEVLWLEVIARKLLTPAAHYQFCHNLLESLFKSAARLPFTFTGPVGRAVDEALQPPSPLFVLQFLASRGADLRAAVGQIVAEPHRLLTDHEQRVPLAQVSEVDADVLLDILRSADEWAHAPGFLLARELPDKAPQHVWQRLPEETFDTPENRFVKRFVEDVAEAGARMLDDGRRQGWWENVAPARQTGIGETLATLDEARRAPVLEDAGPMHRLPTSSQALLRREGYRQALELWRIFHLARRPLFGALAAAMALRSVDKLYEFWCFFELVRRIAKLIESEPVAEIKTSDEAGLRHRTRVEFGGHGTLQYNVGPPSWSVPLRPDFVWHGDDGRKVALDAKFRLDPTDLTAEDDSPSGTAKRADLYKMHTYRDALSLEAAVCLYPGNKNVFWEVGARKAADVTLEALLMGEVEGVGALGMGPRR